MDTGQLQVFDRIVREGGFSRAAWALGIAQATVSARVAALELELGGALFVRGRHTKLTPRGQQFLDYARRALDLLEVGTQQAARAAGDKQSRLDIAVSNSLASGAFARAIGDLLRLHRSVQITARVADCDAIVHAVREGATRLGLLPWPMIGAKDLRPLWSVQETLVLVVGPNHALAAHRGVKIEALTRLAEPLYPVWFDDTSDKQLSQLTPVGQAGIELPLTSVLSLVKAGQGASFMTLALVAEDLRLGHLIAVPVQDLPPLKRKYGLVCQRSGVPLTEVERDFSELAKAAAVATPAMCSA